MRTTCESGFRIRRREARWLCRNIAIDKHEALKLQLKSKSIGKYCIRFCHAPFEVRGVFVGRMSVSHQLIIVGALIGWLLRRISGLLINA